MQLFSTLVALQPQSLRQVTPQADDDIIFSNFVQDGDYVHGEVDKTSVGSIHAGTNNVGNPVEVQTLGVESDPKDICSAPVFHGVSDAAHPTADESTNQTFGSMAAEGCVSAEHAPPTAVSQAFLTPIHEEGENPLHFPISVSFRASIISNFSYLKQLPNNLLLSGMTSMNLIKHFLLSGRAPMGLDRRLAPFYRPVRLPLVPPQVLLTQGFSSLGTTQ